MASAQHQLNREGYSTITDPFHWRNMLRPPTDLLPHNKEVVSIQNEFRTHFGWDLDHDQLSAKELISIVEDSGIDLWSRPNRAATVANIQRRAVLREQNVAILGAAIDMEELVQVLETPTLLITADGAAGVFSLLPDTLLREPGLECYSWSVMLMAEMVQFRPPDVEKQSSCTHMETIERI